MELMEKAYQHESTRADKANDAVIRMLNSEKKEDSAIDDLAKLAGIAALMKKVVN